MKYIIGTREELVDLGQETRDQYDHLIITHPQYGCLVAHKCKKSKIQNRYGGYLSLATPSRIYSHSIWDGFRYQRTKHCKICHKTWPKEIQTTVALINNSNAK